MKKVFLFIGSWLLVTGSSAQTVTQKLQKAFQQFENDSQLKHAISSLYVIDAKTGQVVFDKNSQVGLAPASTQKIITGVTAFELLGKDFKYKTEFWKYKFDEDKSDITLIYLIANGDPTLGSIRYETSSPDNIYSNLKGAYRNNDIKIGNTEYRLLAPKLDWQKIPDGWIWEDIGNYYGAGAGPFNWKENQSDVFLYSGEKEGGYVGILSVDSSVGKGNLISKVKAGAKNSGDNAYYYFSYGNHFPVYPVVKGTIPIGEKRFKISAAVSHPFSYFINDLKRNSLYKKEDIDFYSDETYPIIPPGDKNVTKKKIYTHYSPSLDSIIYWFNKKSINLYGEALIKTFAYEKQGFGSTDSGVAILKKFWKDKGLDEDELNIYDGSGLSPLNRVTTHAQVEILKYARTKEWFPYFLKSLPDYNGMTMKSGTISDVKGFCGYHKAKNGKEYIFSFLVNNYSGKTSGVVNKMYKVLDELK